MDGNPVTTEFSPPIWVSARSSSSSDEPYLVPLNSTHEVNNENCNDWKSEPGLIVNRYLK